MWDQTALAPNAGRQHLLHVAQTRQANNTPWQGDTCAACTPGAPTAPHTHTLQLLCAIKVKQVAQRDFTPLTKHLPGKPLSACCKLCRPSQKSRIRNPLDSCQGGQLCPGAEATAGLSQESSRQLHNTQGEKAPLSDPLKIGTRK